MSILFISGFESDSFVEEASNYAAQIQSTITHTGNFALRCNPTTVANSFVTLMNSPGSSIYVRFYFLANIIPATGDEPLAAIPLSSYDFHIRINSSGKLAVYYSTALQAIGTSVLTTGAWYRIEFSFVASTSLWNLYINGVQELSGQTATNQTVGSIIVGKYVNENGNTVDFYYDDITIRDDQLPGRGHIECLLPRANGSYSQFTNQNSLTASFSDVNQVPYDTATFINNTSGISGEASTFLFTTLLGSPTSINGIKLSLIAEEFGGGPQLGARFVQNTSHFDSGLIEPPVTWSQIAFYYPTNPITALPWTTGDIATLEAGVVGNNFAGGYVTAIYAMIDYSAPDPFYYTASGGAIVSGTASGTRVTSPATSSGVLCSGSALVGRTIFGSGGMICSGTAVPQQGVNATQLSGGVVCAGYCPVTFSIDRSLEPLQIGPITVAAGTLQAVNPKWKNVQSETYRFVSGWVPAITVTNNRL